ncbi:ribbon-helix-helix domain-containing protein [Nostoc sp. 'Peltigera membranacea cyanobiont' 232]|jgi:predicted transcriptional regulator|uniref:ribbon-helix-helix domain-containing protein n=1 Tax=Nostoc sp. 'Peltigera membranacea cyanobiont' 232 TaxID=2014531 RepID=UPI001CB97964|nr:CopG family transcriptional regulator [Nostoc sp. 'Peltigera membranacea cyanobiont' 232]
MNQQIVEINNMGMESVTTYVQPDIKRKLEEWAQEEERSISYLVAKLITEAVNERDKQNQSPKTN